MKKKVTILLLLMCIACLVQGQSTVRLSDITLMHEMRETPSPADHADIDDRSVSFMWPLEMNEVHSGLDGMESDIKEKKPDPHTINYRIRIASDSGFKTNVITADLFWPFYNPEEPLTSGVWYWQYGYVKNGKTDWSQLLRFTIKDNPDRFSPPSYTELIRKLPRSHPRILVFNNEWDEFREKSSMKREAGRYLQRADKALGAEIVHLTNVIDTGKVSELDNEVKKNALLTRESRRIVDREEADTEVLIRAYVLTKNEAYAEAALKRIEEMITWKKTPYFVGDFNRATLLSLCSMAYDSFYTILSEDRKSLLLREIKESGNKIFEGFVNHLENHIADNHNWQMNLRIFTMAAFAVYGELPEANQWTDYSYNLWLARFPGLNKDGGWHNGDSYFHVNIRTLIEVPYFYSRVSGYNFFADPWYGGSGMYVIYQQPPFSKSGGNGSSHQNVKQPNGPRLAYADALARLTGNTYLADYVDIISRSDPGLMQKGFMSKPGDLSWFRLQCDKLLPKGPGLKDLPLSYIFPQTGLASFMSDWGNIKKNAMVTFRSSPYGSTSHALANQNAFNTFYGGKSLFYSSGHHISFTDEHSVYCHRATRAHNTILVNGMGQKIGTEGYGWIPRYYTGKKIGYVLGDASNAYGEVVSPLWQKRGKASGLEYTPENGWDKNRLKTFRRHIIQLGGADLVFIYDELEADSSVTWNYLLHTVEQPMEVIEREKGIYIKASNETGVSEAYLFSEGKLNVEKTDQFFYPAVNWLRADDKGYFAPYSNHWHFTATTSEKRINRFVTIIHTRHRNDTAIIPEFVSEDTIKVGDWEIKANLSSQGKPAFTVENKQESIRLNYEDSTIIEENGKRVELKDVLPELEI